jgi:hypothetical protein
MTDTYPITRREDVIVEEVDGELLLYDEPQELACRLNRTAFRVWESCDGTHSVTDLVDVLRAEVGDVADEDLVRVTLDSLDEHGLILSGYAHQKGKAGRLSRRRFIARAGAVGAAAAALPVVQAIVAPTSAAAQSSDYNYDY